MRFIRRPPVVEMWLGISAFVRLGDDAVGVEIICLVRRFRLNTVFKKGRQMYGMNFLTFHGKFFLYQFWWSMVNVCSKSP